MLFEVLFVGQHVETFAHSSEDDVYWFEGKEDLRYFFVVFVPEGFVLLSAFGVVSESSVGQKNEKVDCVKIAS